MAAQREHGALDRVHLDFDMHKWRKEIIAMAAYAYPKAVHSAGVFAVEKRPVTPKDVFNVILRCNSTKHHHYLASLVSADLVGDLEFLCTFRSSVSFEEAMKALFFHVANELDDRIENVAGDHEDMTTLTWFGHE